MNDFDQVDEFLADFNTSAWTTGLASQLDITPTDVSTSQLLFYIKPIIFNSLNYFFLSSFLGKIITKITFFRSYTDIQMTLTMSALEDVVAILRYINVSIL